ncbi:MAG: hypothetical protein ACT4QD_10465 [Acidobacteriota bacterium]
MHVRPEVADRVARGHDIPYTTLAVVVSAAMLSFTLNQQWAGDFWEHAAVVRELARRPWSPQHPLVAIEAPHPSFSPYTLLAGLCSRYLDLHPITVLSGLGLTNLLVLLVSFRWFAAGLVGARATTYGLVFTLVLWGRDPWLFSGFLHAGMLGFALPYPSTLATGLTLLCFHATLRLFDSGDRRWGVLLTVAAPVVLVTHPVIGVALAAGLVSLSLGSAVRQPARVATLGVVVLIVALGSASLWPYYPWLSLVLDGGGGYGELNRPMYEHIVARAWPALLAIPLLARRFAADPTDRLACFTGALGVVYALGALTGAWMLGRVLPLLVLGLHLVLADAVARAEAQWSGVARRRALRLILAAVVVAGMINLAPGFVRFVPRTLLPASLADDPRLARIAHAYADLPRYISPDDVVMADANIGRILPSWAGRVIAVSTPQPFVADDAARRDDVRRYFADAGADERRAIARRYGARAVLIDRILAPIDPAASDSLDTLGTVVYDDGRLRLIRFSPDTGEAAQP